MDVKKKRLLWLCRRGIREMDLLFKQYINEHYEQLDQQQLTTLEALLNEADLDIMDWIMQRRKVNNPAYQAIINEMQQLHSKSLTSN